MSIRLANFIQYLFAMGKSRKITARQVLEKIAVAQEPGLTNAQLMLVNHDLKPGMESSMNQNIRAEDGKSDSY